MYNFGINGIGTNGFMNQIMQSSSDADLLIKDFENAIKAGYDPNDVKDSILKQRGIKESDLTDSDIARINRRVEKIYESHLRGGQY